MLRLLFPGRHHLLTNFQLQYLTRVISGDPATLVDIAGQPLGAEARFTAILWAITSANHANTRRNPLPGHRREVAIEELAAQLDVPSYVFLIDDLGATPRFAEYLIKKIAVDSQGRFNLTPEDTVVACSTPEVIELYERLGFRILPVELADRHRRRFNADTPWHVLQRLVDDGLAGRDWRVEEPFVTRAARATRRLYAKYLYGDLIIDLHRSTLLTDDGDLTEDLTCPHEWNQCLSPG